MQEVLELTKLEEQVLNQLGYDELNDEAVSDLKNVTNHGAEGGFVGFTYYQDTIDFFNKNKDLILENVQDLALDLGEDMLTMISNFNCLKAFELTPTDIMSAVYEEGSEWETNVKNALSWYALEEVANNIVNRYEEE